MMMIFFLGAVFLGGLHSNITQGPDDLDLGVCASPCQYLLFQNPFYTIFFS
jgi:hypothetical protein